MTNQILNFSAVTPNSSKPDNQMTEVCIANINPRERRKRLIIGIAAFIFGLVVLGAMLAFNVQPAWRLMLFFIFWGAGVSYFEARDKTCVMLAVEQTRIIGDEKEKVEDQDELKQIRRQSIKLTLKALLVALVLTAISLLIP